MKKFKVLMLAGLIVSLGACTNMSGGSSSSSNSYTEADRANFNVQEETQLYAVGNATVTESGVAVAKMKAKDAARAQLKKEIYNETTNVLNAFFGEINTKNITISKNTIEDLSKLVTAQLIDEAVQTNAWNNENKEYVVLAIDKSRIPEKVKEIFVIHVQGIINNLNNAIDKVSKEYQAMANPNAKEDIVETPKKDKNSVEKNTETEKKESSSIKEATEENAEDEVILEEF
jgi:hypothetical protein